MLSGDAYSRTKPANPVDLLAATNLLAPNPRESVAARRKDAVLTKSLRRRRCVPAAPILQYSGEVCARDVHASLGRCRSLLPLAFDLEKSSDMMGARLMTREIVPIQPQADWSRSGKGLLGAQKTIAESGI